MIQWKGILWFLAITFSLTYAVEFGMILAGLRIDGPRAVFGQLIVAGLMWAPALAALISARWITREGFRALGLRVGPLRAYGWPLLIVPLCFVVIYGLTWLLGLGQPDWQLDSFYGLVRASGGDMSQAPSPGLFLGIVGAASLTTLPFVNGLFAFGEELGWRGYLLPRLMPLGKGRAYLISGVVWGLWHLPLLLIGFTYPGANPILAVLAFTAVTTALGIFINELSLRYRSSILAGWLHGLFNTQKLGVWAALFPQVNVLWGGYAGLVGIGVWLALGLITVAVLRRQPAPRAVAAAAD